MENLINTIDKAYLNVIDKGYSGCMHIVELVQHPKVPGILLRKRYEFIIFKNDKIMTYYNTNNNGCGVYDMFENDDPSIKFKLPGYYVTNPILRPVKVTDIADIVKNKLSVNVSNVSKSEKYIELYKNPIYVKAGSGYDTDLIVAGDYVKTYTMKYESICENASNEYDFDDEDIYENINVDPMVSCMWLEYSTIVQVSGNMRKGMTDSIRKFVDTYKISDSLSSEAIIIDDVPRHQQNTTVNCVEALIHEFIYDNPAFSGCASYPMRKNMYNLLRMIAVEIPINTVFSISDVKGITEYIIKYFNGSDILFDTRAKFGLHRPAVFRRTDYTKLSIKHTLIATYNIPTAVFFQEFQRIMDLGYGILYELEGGRMLEYDKHVSDIEMLISKILAVFMSTIPKHMGTRYIIGENTIEYAKRHSMIGRPRSITF